MTVTHTDVRTTHTENLILLLYVVVDYKETCVYFRKGGKTLEL